VTPLITSSCVTFSLFSRSCPTSSHASIYTIWRMNPFSLTQAFTSKHSKRILTCGTGSPHFTMKKLGRRVIQTVPRVTMQQVTKSFQKVAPDNTRGADNGHYMKQHMAKCRWRRIIIVFYLTPIQRSRRLHLQVHSHSRMWHSERTECDCNTCELEAMKLKLEHQQQDIAGLRDS
jgi:hypothetical protein